MADIVGLDGLHNIEGYKCDLCGGDCDPKAQELNALDCTFASCPKTDCLYHQECLEKYLKSIKLEKNRKTGFKCPRGCGKGTKHDHACPGKITKSHPIHIRNDDCKKRKKALPPPPMPFQPKKDRDKPPEPKAKEGSSVGKKGKEPAVGEKPKAKSPSKPKAASVPVHSPTAAAKQQLENARRELAAKGHKVVVPGAKPAAAPVAKDHRSYAEFDSEKKAAPSPVANAWSSRPAPARLMPVDYPPPPPPPPPPPAKPSPGAQQQPGPWAAAAASMPNPPAPGPARPKPQGLRAVSVFAEPPNATLDKGKVLVGGELAEPEGKLSKAQKKNMKRMEKKAAARATTDASVASSEIVSEMLETISEEMSDPTGEAESSLTKADSFAEDHSSPETSPELPSNHERCIQALMHTKAKYLIGQLRSLGFQDWQCAVAIMQHGSRLEACIAFLLEDHIASEEESRAYMVAHTLAPPIDVSEELQMLAEAQDFLGLPMDIVERAVADADGDLEAAVDSLLEQAERQPDQEVVTPKQTYLQLSSHHQQGPPQQNGHSPWQSTPTQPDAASSTPLSVSSRSPWEQQQHQLHPQQHLQQQSQQQSQQQQGLPAHVNGVRLPEKPGLWSCLDNSGDASANRWDQMGSSQAHHQQQPQQQHASRAPPGLKQPPPPLQPAANGAAHMQGLFSSGLNLSLSNGDFLSSRLTSYQTAVSGEGTPTAAPEPQGPWETPYLHSTSVASSQQGHGEGFSMFSTDSGRQGHAEGRAGSIWGDSQSRAANMDQYTQLLQQGPAVRSSLDSRSSGGLFGGQPELYQQGSGGLRQEAMFASQASASPGHALQQSSPWAASPLGKSGTQGSIWSSMPSESKLGIDAPEAALLAAAAVASDPEPRNGARDPNDPELELDSLMATLMCS